MSTRYALGVLLAINTLNFFDRQVLSAVAEPLRVEWRLSDAELGALSTAFTLLYAFVGVPFGRLADRRTRRLILAGGCLAWSVLTVLSGFARGFWELFALRLGVGIGEASCAPAANSLIGDLVPRERRARALSIFMLGLPLGLALSYLVSGAIAEAYGWRTAFFVAGMPGVLIALAALAIEEPTRTRLGLAPQKEAPYLRLLTIPTLLWIIASGALHNFNMYAISSFLSPFLMRYHRLSVRDAGLGSTLVYGVAGGVGLYLGGFLSDQMAARRKDGRLLLSAGATLLSIPLTGLALRCGQGDAAGFAVFMALAVLAMYVYYGSVYAAIQDVVPTTLRGTALALYFFGMYSLGASLGPFLTGLLSDRMTARAAARAGSVDLEMFRAEGLHAAFSVVPVLGVVLVSVLLAAARTAPKDMRRLETVTVKRGGALLF